MNRRLQQNLRNSGGYTFFGGDSLFFVFRSLLLTVFNYFKPFGNFFYLKTTLSDAPKQRRKIGDG
jgi:hypothetical protein